MKRIILIFFLLHLYGPLATLHDRSKKEKPVYCRYDIIYATPDFKVNGVKYLFENSLRAGSDHSLIVADLDLPEK